MGPCELAPPSFPSRSASRLYTSMGQSVPSVNTAAVNQHGGLLPPPDICKRISITNHVFRMHTVLTVGCMIPPKLSPSALRAPTPKESRPWAAALSTPT